MFSVVIFVLLPPGFPFDTSAAKYRSCPTHTCTHTHTNTQTSKEGERERERERARSRYYRVDSLPLGPTQHRDIRKAGSLFISLHSAPRLSSEIRRGKKKKKLFGVVVVVVCPCGSTQRELWPIVSRTVISFALSLSLPLC